MSNSDQSNFKRFADPGSKGILGWGRDPDEGKKSPPPPPPLTPPPGTSQFSTLRQNLSGAADAAGSFRSESDADLLGLGNVGARAKSASRRLLGS